MCHPYPYVVSKDASTLQLTVLKPPAIQPGIAWLTFYRSYIRVAVRLRCLLCTMTSRDPYSKSNIGRDHHCQICPAGATLLWRNEFFLGVLKFDWSAQYE